MFRCCFRNEDKKQTVNPLAVNIIKWSDTVPFVPPIVEGPVIKVYDGDTITIAAKLPYDGSPLYRFSIRLAGIDTPEIKGKTEKEKELAKNAKHALEDMILYKTVQLKNAKMEKYGRILADVYFGDIHVNKWLIDNGFAVVYDGGQKTTIWDSTHHPHPSQL